MASSSSSSSSFADSSRIHFWNYVLNSDGDPIQNVEIRFYLNDNPTIEANIYVRETSSVHTKSSLADLKTDENGFFEFWIGNSWEDGGYDYTQEFRIEWFKAGTIASVIENINPWSNILAWESKNSGAGKDDRNKFVSNFYATKWWNHINEIVPSASPHNLEAVDYNSGCDDNLYDKVVSNKFLNDIITLSNASSATSSLYGGVNEHQEDVTSWVPSSGIFYKDISHPNIMGKNVTMYAVKLNSEDRRRVIPKRIRNLNSTSTRIFMDNEVDLRVNVQGSSSSSSSVSSSSSSSSSM